jgi:hypothetical protein
MRTVIWNDGSILEELSLERSQVKIAMRAELRCRGKGVASTTGWLI